MLPLPVLLSVHAALMTIVLLLLTIALVLGLTASTSAQVGREADGSASHAALAAAPPAAPVEAIVAGDESIEGPGTSAEARRVRGEYAGPLVRIDSSGACPVVAKAFFRMRAAALEDRIRLRVTSGFRTRPHQARLYRELGPQWAARPGKTLHHDATELDIRMMPGAGNPVHRWLQAHAGDFGFLQRYSWEPWHWGYVRGC